MLYLGSYSTKTVSKFFHIKSKDQIVKALTKKVVATKVLLIVTHMLSEDKLNCMDSSVVCYQWSEFSYGVKERQIEIYVFRGLKQVATLQHCFVLLMV